VLGPWSDRLSFLPQPGAQDPAGPEIVWRRTADETRRALETKAPNRHVEAQREALAVWNPFTDELLEHWLETLVDGVVAQRFPLGWRDRGRALLDRYDQLALAHTRTRKHWDPRRNPAILRLALLEAVNGPLSAKRRGLLQNAVEAMVAKRGAPGSPQHTALRKAQARVAALPSHADLARALATRVADESPSRGLANADELTAGLPRSIRRIVDRGRAGTPRELIDRGVVSSAEVLAELVPRLAAAKVSEAYEDERLRLLMRKTYEAFRRRRSLLLLDLQHQVRIEELPWVRAVAPLRRSADTLAAFTALATLTLDAFPATLVPNAMLTELDALAREAGLELPLTEELAADIFMGRFSAKYVRAAELAGERLKDSLYARYYRIDYDALADFDALCARRAGPEGSRSLVARNGRVIEQAQIITTHNLAALSDYADLDYGAVIERAVKQARRLAHDRRKFAFAWRQIVFYASFTDVRPDVHGTALQPLFAGLERGDPPFLGWR